MEQGRTGLMRTRETISEMTAGRLSAPDALSALVRPATLPIIGETLGAANRDVLGRGGHTLTLNSTQAPSHGSNRKGQATGCTFCSGPGKSNGKRPVTWAASCSPSTRHPAQSPMPTFSRHAPEGKLYRSSFELVPDTGQNAGQSGESLLQARGFWTEIQGVMYAVSKHRFPDWKSVTACSSNLPRNTTRDGKRGNRHISHCVSNNRMPSRQRLRK